MNDTIKACQEAAQILLELRQKKFPPTPSGWFTIEQFAGYMDYCVPVARRDMSILIKSGKFVSRNWPKLDSRGHSVQQTIYRKKQ